MLSGWTAIPVPGSIDMHHGNALFWDIGLLFQRYLASNLHSPDGTISGGAATLLSGARYSHEFFCLLRMIGPARRLSF